MKLSEKEGDFVIFFRKAVLIIHGFSGGTYEHEQLSFHLQRYNTLDVYTFTLPGHDMSSLKSVKYTEWLESAEEKVKLLMKYGYKNIYLVGHSMGGVIATYLSTKYRSIKKLVLLAPAFSYFSSNVDSSLGEKVKGGINALKKNEPGEIINKVLSVPLTAVGEFVEFIDEYKGIYKKINIPVLVLHGKEDSVVPVESSMEAYDHINVDDKKLVLLEDTTHLIFKKENKIALNEISKFLLN